MVSVVKQRGLNCGGGAGWRLCWIASTYSPQRISKRRSRQSRPLGRVVKPRGRSTRCGQIDLTGGGGDAEEALVS